MGGNWCSPHLLLRRMGSYQPGVLLQRGWGPGLRNIPQAWREQCVLAFDKEMPQVNRILGWKKVTLSI